MASTRYNTTFASQNVKTKAKVTKGRLRNQDKELVSKLFKDDHILKGIFTNQYLIDLEGVKGKSNISNIKTYEEMDSPVDSAIKKIHIALYLVLPEILNFVTKNNKEQLLDRLNTDGFMGEEIVPHIFNEQSKRLVKIFQESLSANNLWPVNSAAENDYVFFSNTDNDGIVGYKTLNALDKILDRIKYYKIDPISFSPNGNYALRRNKILHSAISAKKVGAFTRVSHNVDYLVGLAIKSEPRPKSTFTEEEADCFRVLRPIEFVPSGDPSLNPFFWADDRVFIKDIFEVKDVSGNTSVWCFVEADREKTEISEEMKLKCEELGISRTEGYVEAAFLWTNSPMPEPTARLVKFSQANASQGLIHFVNEYYGYTSTEEDPDDDMVAKFIGTALLYVHNPTGLLNYGNQLDSISKKTISKLNPATGKYDINQDVSAAIYLNPLTAAKTFFGPFNSLLQGVGVLPPSMTMKFEDQSFANWITTVEAIIGNSFSPYESSVLIEDRYIWAPSKNFLLKLNDIVNIGKLCEGRSLSSVVKDLALTKIRSFLNSWPKGLGFELDGSLGATFGLPVAEIGATFRITKTDDNILTIVRKGYLEAGVEAGVGESLYFGAGKKSKSSKYGYGLGSEYYASISDKMKISVEQEMKFDYRDDHTIASALLAIIESTGLLAVADVLSFGLQFGNLFAKTLKAFNIDPDDYTSKLSLQFQEKKQGAAYAGIKVQTKTEDNYWNKPNKNNNEKTYAFRLARLLELIGLKYDIGVNAEVIINGGVELEYTYQTEIDRKNNVVDPVLEGNIDLKTNVRRPATVAISLFLEGGLKVENLGSISVPLVTDIDLTGGVKFDFLYTYDASQFDIEPTDPGYVSILGLALEYKGLSLYKKSGEESSFEIALSPTISSLDFTSIEGILNNITAIKYERDFSHEFLAGKKGKSIAKFQNVINKKVDEFYNENLRKKVRKVSGPNDPNDNPPKKAAGITDLFPTGALESAFHIKIEIKPGDVFKVLVNPQDISLGYKTVSVKDILREIIDDLVNNQNFGYKEIMYLLLSYFIDTNIKILAYRRLMTPAAFKSFMALIRKVVSIFRSVTSTIEAKVVITGKVGVSFGAYLSIGAGIALRFSGNGSVIFETDVRSIINALISQAKDNPKVESALSSLLYPFLD